VYFQDLGDRAWALPPLGEATQVAKVPFSEEMAPPRGPLVDIAGCKTPASTSSALFLRATDLLPPLQHATFVPMAWVGLGWWR
jgi:hypothetical protein